MTRTVSKIAAAAVASVALAGCIRLDTNITIAEDGTADATSVFAVNELLLELAAIDAGTGDELNFDELLGDGGMVAGIEEASEEQGLDVEIRDYDQDGYVGLEIAYEGIDPTDLAAQSASFGVTTEQSLVREGDFFILTQGAFDASGLDGLGGDFDGMDGGGFGDELGGFGDLGDLDPTELFEITLSVTFPGDVVESSMGRIEGNTVYIDGDELLSGEELYIKAGAVAPFDWTGLLTTVGIVLAVLVGLALIAAAVWFYAVRPMRQRRAVEAEIAVAKEQNAASAAKAAAAKSAPAKKSATSKAPAKKAPAKKPAAKKATTAKPKTD